MLASNALSSFVSPRAIPPFRISLQKKMDETPRADLLTAWRERNAARSVDRIAALVQKIEKLVAEHKTGAASDQALFSAFADISSELKAAKVRILSGVSTSRLESAQNNLLSAVQKSMQKVKDVMAAHADAGNVSPRMTRFNELATTRIHSLTKFFDDAYVKINERLAKSEKMKG